MELIIDFKTFAIHSFSQCCTMFLCKY